LRGGGREPVLLREQPELYRRAAVV